MSDQKKPTEINDADLDQAAGGNTSTRTFIKSWSISGDADDRPTEEVALKAPGGTAAAVNEELTLGYTEIKWTY